MKLQMHRIFLWREDFSLSYAGDIFATDCGDAIEQYRRRTGRGKGTYAVPYSGSLTFMEKEAVTYGVLWLPSTLETTPNPNV